MEMIENVFKKKYAECLILRHTTDAGGKGEAVGLALVCPLPSIHTPLTALTVEIVLLHVLDVARDTGSLRES